jgi:hypothetical protein
VQPLPGPVLAGSRATDFGVNLATAARLVKACSYGTAEVKLWCSNRYDDSDLATAWSINRIASAAAAAWVCRRRGQPLPLGVKEEYEEAQFKLKEINRGSLWVEDIGTRSVQWPFFSNVTVDVRYTVAKVRAQPIISESTPTLYPQMVDYNSLFAIQDFWAFI